MEYQLLGNTGLRIPPIVFGTSSLGNLFKELSSEDKGAIIREWFAHVPEPVFADSAGKYGAGLALEVMGEELEALGIAPADVVISNKLGWRRKPLSTPEPTFEPGAWIGLKHDALQDISYDGMFRCWAEGCTLLGKYRPALVSVHDPDEYLAAAKSESERASRWEDILGAYRALGELKDSGVVAGVGVGSKDWRMIRKISDHCELDWAMIANSFTLYCHTKELQEFIEDLSDKNIGVINSAVFHSGFLVGGSHFDYAPVGSDSELFAWRETFFSICEKHGVLPAHACVEFAASPPGITALALNSSDPARVKKNVGAVGAMAPVEFWADMKAQGQVDSDYPYL